MGSIARIIGEAGIRLRADSKGLGAEMRGIFRTALNEATKGLRPDPGVPGPGKAMEEDAERSSTRVRGILAGLLGAGKAAGSGLAAAAFQGANIAIIGAKAGVALAGVTSLATGVAGLVAAAGAAAGALGLIPAALIAVKAATATVTLGMTGMGDAFKAVASGDAAALTESLKNLAPSAASFVREVAKAKPAFDGMRLDVQQRLFAGLSDSVGGLATRYLPVARSLFGGLADDMNGAAKGIARFATSGETMAKVNTLAGGIRQSFQNLLPALQPALSAFLDIGSVGSTVLPRVTGAIADMATRFSAFISNAAASGQLAEFFNNALDVLSQLGRVLGSFGSGLANVFGAAQQAGGGLLGTLESVGNAFKEATASPEGQEALLTFFASMKNVIAAVLPVVFSLAQVIGTSLVPIIANLAGTIVPALQPLVDALGPALAAAAPGIAAMASGFATLLGAAAPLIGIAGQLAGIIGGALGKVFTALAPVLVKVANALSDGLNTLMPVLAPIIDQVATALGDLLSGLVPLIPIFFQLIAAVLPIVPPLMQLVAAVLPPLVTLVQAVVPIIKAFADILVGLLPPITAVVTTILNILIPPIQLIAAIVTQVASITAQVIGTMSSTITGILTALGAIISGIWATIIGIWTGAITSIGNFVRNGFASIRDTVSGAVSGARDAVGNAIDGIVRFFRELPGKVLGFLGDLASKAVGAGKDIVQGIVNGIGSLGSAIRDKLMGMVNAAWDSVLSFFGISSPSKLAKDTFEWVIRGAIVGLDGMSVKLNDTARAVAEQAMAALNAPLSGGVSLPNLAGAAAGAGAAGGGLGGVVLNQTNVMQPGTDGAQFAAYVGERSFQKLTTNNSVMTASVGSVQAGRFGADHLGGVNL